MTGRSKKRDLKQQFAQAFIQQVVEFGTEKVCVLDITKFVGVNKNSFYYYFNSKVALANWIFRHDVASMLIDSFAPEYLVYLGEDKGRSTRNADKDSFPELAYYVREPSGARMLNQGAFFRSLVVCLRERQPYYKRLLLDGSGGNLKTYIESLYLPAFRADIEFIADGRYLPTQTIEFLSKYFLKSFVGMLDELVCATRLPKEILDDQKNPFWNIAPESIAQAIRSHPVTRTGFPLESYWI